MVGRERLAVMMRGKEHVVAVKVGQGHVGGKTLLGVDQNVFRFRLDFRQLEHFLKGDALPVIVKAAPARDTVEVAVRFYLG